MVKYDLFSKTGWMLDEPAMVEETGRYDSIMPTIVRSPFGYLGGEGEGSAAASVIELGFIHYIGDLCVT
jgi:hypothetical protein